MTSASEIEAKSTVCDHVSLLAWCIPPLSKWCLNATNRMKAIDGRRRRVAGADIPTRETARWTRIIGHARGSD